MREKGTVSVSFNKDYFEKSYSKSYILLHYNLKRNLDAELCQYWSSIPSFSRSNFLQITTHPNVSGNRPVSVNNDDPNDFFLFAVDPLSKNWELLVRQMPKVY